MLFEYLVYAWSWCHTAYDGESILHSSIVTKYQLIQRQEARAPIDSLPHLTSPFIRQSASFLVFECGKIKIIISSFAAIIIMRIGYGIAVQKSDDPYISVVAAWEGLWHYGSHLIWLVSHFEMCTELVSRCRFPKEGCTLEDLPTWWPEYLFFAYKNNWHKFFFWELMTHELQCLVCMIT